MIGEKEEYLRRRIKGVHYLLNVKKIHQTETKIDTFCTELALRFV